MWLTILVLLLSCIIRSIKSNDDNLKNTMKFNDRTRRSISTDYVDQHSQIAETSDTMDDYNNYYDEPLTYFEIERIMRNTNFSRSPSESSNTVKTLNFGDRILPTFQSSIETDVGTKSQSQDKVSIRINKNTRVPRITLKNENARRNLQKKHSTAKTVNSESPVLYITIT